MNKSDFSFASTPHFLWLDSPSRGGAVGGGTALQAGRSRVLFPMMSFH